MPALTLTEWRNSPEMAALLACLRRRKLAAVQTFLAGSPVDPVTQGRTAALHDIEELLTKPVDELRAILEAELNQGAKTK